MPQIAFAPIAHSLSKLRLFFVLHVIVCPTLKARCIIANPTDTKAIAVTAEMTNRLSQRFFKALFLAECAIQMLLF